MRSNICPKCQGSMTVGFILDRADHRPKIATWVEGAPVRSFWCGVKVRKAIKHEIQTWRCGRCGFLESYAKG